MPTENVPQFGHYYQSAPNPSPQLHQNSQESGTYFGPPRMEDGYNPSEWDVVPRQSYSVIDDPSRFKRSPREVPVIIPSTNGEVLAPFLMILHSIPQARDALLSFSFQTYGFHPYWWRGNETDFIQIPKHVTSLARNSHEKLDVRMLLEVQRLVAFLDGDSQRAFASIECLINASSTLPPNIASDGEDNSISSSLISTFLSILIKLSDQHKLFSSLFVTTLFSKSIGYKDINSFMIYGDMRKKNLYESLNTMFWGPGMAPGDMFISKLSDVLIFNFINEKDDNGALGTSLGVGVEIPSVFYPQRYKKKYVPQIIKACEKKEEMDKARREVSKEQLKLSSVGGIETSQLLQITIDFLNFEQEGWDIDEDDNDKPKDQQIEDAIGDLRQFQKELLQKRKGLREKMQEFEHTSRNVDLFDVINNSEQNPKLDEIITDNDHTMESSGELPSSFSDPKQDTEGESTEKIEAYILAGAILNDNILFVRNKSQWLKIQFEISSTVDFTIQDVDEQKVKDEVRDITDKPLEKDVSLIYAIESAYDSEYSEREPPEALQKFIKKDYVVLEKSLIIDEESESEGMDIESERGVYFEELEDIDSLSVEDTTSTIQPITMHDSDEEEDYLPTYAPLDASLINQDDNEVIGIDGMNPKKSVTNSDDNIIIETNDIEPAMNTNPSTTNGKSNENNRV